MDFHKPLATVLKQSYSGASSARPRTGPARISMSHLGSLGEMGEKNRRSVCAQTTPNEPGWRARQCRTSPNERPACFSAWGSTGVDALVRSSPPRLLPKEVINHRDRGEPGTTEVQMWHGTDGRVKTSGLLLWQGFCRPKNEQMVSNITFWLLTSLGGPPRGRKITRWKEARQNGGERIVQKWIKPPRPL